MATLIADLFVTVKDRYALAHRSLTSLFENTPRDKFRLTVCIDGALDKGSEALIDLCHTKADYVLFSHENVGLGPTINRAVAHICSINEWAEDPKVPDSADVAPFICMLQDDIKYSSGWLQKLSSRFIGFEKSHNLGFASGIECIEHPAKEWLSKDCLLKDWIRATCMFGRRSYWKSMMPITRFDPETGRVRGKPNDGLGSGVDWWLIRNHANSVCMTGRTCLVMPGLLQHEGYDQSTWLKREMPESDADKEKIKNG